MLKFKRKSVTHLRDERLELAAIIIKITLIALHKRQLQLLLHNIT